MDLNWEAVRGDDNGKTGIEETIFVRLYLPIAQVYCCEIKNSALFDFPIHKIIILNLYAFCKPCHYMNGCPDKMSGDKTSVETKHLGTKRPET